MNIGVNADEFEHFFQIEGAIDTAVKIIEGLQLKEEVPVTICTKDNVTKNIAVRLISNNAFLCSPGSGIADFYYYREMKKISIPKVSLVSN